MGSTLTHVRYYLDDPVHLLVSCANHKFVHHLGSGINLMPLSVMEKLGIFEVQAARISLEMADKSNK